MRNDPEYSDIIDSIDSNVIESLEEREMNLHDHDQ